MSARALRCNPLRLAPRPYRDELLYSVIARAAPYVLGSSPKRLADVMFGSRGALAIPDLPSRLGAFMKRASVAWGLTMDDVAREHTAIAYYLHFRGAAAYTHALQALQGTGAWLHERLGVCASVVRDTTHFRLCPECVAADLRLRGETYWRRSHQLPGVLICVEHRVALRETNVPFRPPTRHAFVPASAGALDGARCHDLSNNRDLVLYIAQASARLASSRPIGAGDLCDRRDVMRELGYAGRRGGLARLIDDFAQYMGPALVTALFEPRTRGAHLNWLAESLRAPRRHLQPLQAILLERFVEQQARTGFTSKPATHAPHPMKWAMRRPLRGHAKDLVEAGLTHKTAANALGATGKSAAQLTSPTLLSASATDPAGHCDREAWTALCAAHPDDSKAQLRKRKPSLYRRLYRHDHYWLLEQQAAPPARSRTGTVDWGARDRALVQRVSEMATGVVTRVPLRRVSRHYVLGQLHARALIALYGHHLPLTGAALDEHCESVEDFQLRRIAHADKTISVHGRTAPDWRVLRAARINPARFADGARALLARGRKAERA